MMAPVISTHDEFMVSCYFKLTQLNIKGVFLFFSPSWQRDYMEWAVMRSPWGTRLELAPRVQC